MSIWYRRLRGGMWIRSLWSWSKVLPEHYDTALSLLKKGYMIEDHRYFRGQGMTRNRWACIAAYIVAAISVLAWMVP